ncbi:MAG: TolC family protein, partial [Bacteroides sp.]
NLNQALDIALSENPTIKVADKEIVLKKESRKEAFAGLFPEVALVGSYTRNLKIQKVAIGGNVLAMGTDNTYGGGLTIALPIYAPALYKSINLTATDVNLAVEKSRASKLDLVNQVTKAYYQLLLAQDSYNVLLRSYSQSEDNYKVVKAKYEQGTVSEYDKISAEVQMRNLKPTVISAQNGKTLACLQLKVLMGLEANINLAVVGNLKDYEMQLFARMNDGSLSLNNNSDLLQLELNAKMLEQSLKLQRTNFLPSLGLSFDYMYTSMNSDFKFSTYRWYPKSAIALNLSIPLFKASNFTKVKQTKIQMNQLMETRINAERQLKMQATSYQNNMQASTEQVIGTKESVKQANKGREIATKRYEVGAGTILELNNSEVVLTQAELTYNQAIYDYLVSQADLDKVLGRDRIVESPEENIQN